MVGAFTFGAVALTVAVLGLLIAAPGFLPKPEWGLVAFAGSVACGGAGLFVSLLHFLRNESDRTFAVLCSIPNVVAVATPVLALIARR